MAEAVDSNASQLAATITSNRTLNIKTGRQIKYKPVKETFTPKHTYTPLHHIDLGLGVNRNNLLSAPNYGLSITPTQYQRNETRIANAVITKCQKMVVFTYHLIW